MDRSVHIAFCGGGSGGHITPGLAVATHLLAIAPQSTFLFLTSNREIDATLLEASELIEDQVSVVPQSIRGGSGQIRTVWQTLCCTLQCLRQFRKKRPDAVVGSGGFASVPGVLAGRWLRIPIALIEQNSIPGKANRFLNRFADVTFVGWPLQPRFQAKWRSAVVDVGVPLRKEFHFQPSPSPWEASSTRTAVLVLGGSQGAEGLNRLVTDALTMAEDWLQGCDILHQTGVSSAAWVRDAYSPAAISVEVRPFLNRLSDHLMKADLVISRAGAVSLAEIASTGTASILIPLPSSADGHQLANAKILENAGAAKIVDQNQESAANRLLEAMREFLTVPMSRVAAGQKARTLVRMNAAAQISKWLLNRCGTSIDDVSRDLT